MKYSEKISNKLNDLLEKNYDAEKGYTLAKDKIENPTLETFFKNMAAQRNKFGNELKKEIMEYGQLPNKDGSIHGNLHRAWMNLTATLSTDESERMLEEVERGEKASLRDYDEVLKEDDLSLFPSTKTLLERHRNTIANALTTADIYEEVLS